MTDLEHKQRHAELHKMLDELVADWITQTHSSPSRSSVMDLLRWATQQAEYPDHDFGMPVTRGVE